MSELNVNFDEVDQFRNMAAACIDSLSAVSLTGADSGGTAGFGNAVLAQAVTSFLTSRNEDLRLSQQEASALHEGMCSAISLFRETDEDVAGDAKALAESITNTVKRSLSDV